MNDFPIVDVQRVLRDRIAAIAAQQNTELKHVLFMVAQEHDDLSVFLDPDFRERHCAFLSAMTPEGYRGIQAAVRVLLREINEFQIDTYTGLCHDRCRRCGTPRPANGWGAPRG